MKKNLAVAVEDQDLEELCRIFSDRDQAGALAFLEEHVRGRAVDLLEGG